MSNAVPAASPEYEFNDQQNALIGDLARKMALVGFVLVLFGALQIAHGIMTFIGGRNPQQALAAAKEAGMSAEQLKRLETAFASSWLNPITTAAISFVLAGVLLLMVGFWNQQAAGGFAGMVTTQGKDISRLMDALGALRKKYSLMYNLIMFFAILSLISLAVGIFHWWKGS
jgi:hypothetical protein